MSDNLRQIDLYLPFEGRIEQSFFTQTAHDIREKIRLSRKAQHVWSSYSIEDRAEYLQKVVKVLREESITYAEKISRYNGKLPDEALVTEIFPTLNAFDYYSGKIRHGLKPKKVFLRNLPVAKAQIEYSPIGVIGIISPWNYPFKLALQDVAPALMAGNSVVIKISEHAAGIGLIIDELFKAAKFPPGLVQCFYGYGDLGQQLLQEELIQKVVFIGSMNTGQKVARLAGEKLIPCTLELGGKDAAIVLEDCNIDKTVQGVTWGAFTNCGQTCASIELLFVPNKIKAPFLKALKEYFDSIPPENFGRMNVLFQRHIVEEQLNEALRRGAKIFAEKSMETQKPATPFRINPVIVTDVAEDTALFSQETFGPILPVAFYDDVEEVINKVNASPYGLTTGIWSEDYEKATQIARRIDSGVVTINDHMITPGLPEAPWLGHKKSGMGYSSGDQALINFSKMKFIYHDRGLIKYKFWQYPYNQEKRQWIVNFLKGTFSASLWEKLLTMLRTLPKFLLGL